jgi:hypothetical protein
MSAPTPQIGGPAPTDPQSPGGTPPTTPPAGDGQPQPQPPKPSYQFASQAEAEAAFQNMLKEKQEANREAQTIKAKLKQFEDAQLTEQQKLQRDLEDARAKAQQAILKAAKADVLVMAQQMGFIHPGDAVALIEAKLQIGEDGVASNAKDLLEKLKADRPGYLQSSQPPAPAPGSISPTNPGGAPGAPLFTAAQLEDLDFYAKNRDAIMQARREGRIQ